VTKALSSFESIFDRSNLDGANSEVQNLLVVAQFTLPEKHKFLSEIRKYLNSQNVSLDFLDNITQ